MAICAIGPMAVIILSPIIHAGLFKAANVFPIVPTGGSWHSHASWMLIFKDMFVAAWAVYGIEAASTTIAELRDPHKDAPKAITAVSIAGFFSYVVMPFVLLAIVGVSVISQDASVAFLPAAQAIFGHVGGIVVSIMLITALLLGVQTTIIGSSRSVYQMTQDGQMIKQFGTINKFGVPVGSMYLDLATTIGLLIVFKSQIISLIAASNVGYLFLWLLLIPCYIILRRTQPDMVRSFKLPGMFIVVAALITAFNVFIFTVGGFQWGKAVWLPGTTILLLFVPFYFYRKLVQDKRPGHWPTPAGPPAGTEGRAGRPRRTPRGDPQEKPGVGKRPSPRRQAAGLSSGSKASCPSPNPLEQGSASPAIGEPLCLTPFCLSGATP